MFPGGSLRSGKQGHGHQPPGSGTTGMRISGETEKGGMGQGGGDQEPA